tara:strand:- start:5694 stop:6731 length:1038 start_codon:yes stop_codon:yes gene_type:complete
MYLFSFGTRPEIIKQFPLINEFKKRGIPYETLFTSQHKDLIEKFSNLIDEPTYILDGIFKKEQSLNLLVSKLLKKAESIISKNKESKIIVQGDTSSAFSVGLAGFQNNNKIIHLEAGLRTYNLKSPFPEEANRSLISKIADMHLCPTENAFLNLKNEGVSNNVYNVGNTIVDSFKFITESKLYSSDIKNLVESKKSYLLCTLHRRENREKMINLWDELNIVSQNRNIIYIKHPSVKGSSRHLSKEITQIEPLSYQDMVYLINNSDGVISDSGGIQEEVISAKKNILICRDTTERPETINSGYGKLVDKNISKNIKFLENKNQSVKNPYGKNVSSKITDIVQKIYG